MHVSRLIARTGVAAVVLGMVAGLLPGPARLQAQPPEHEQNDWPVLVRQNTPDGDFPQWTAAGPLLFGRLNHDEPGTTTGLRPFWIQRDDAAGHFRAGFFLYPLFSYRRYEHTYRWNVLELLRRTGRRHNAPAPNSRYSTGSDFEFWPFIFWRQTGDPAMSYAGLFPLGGTVRDKLGFDRASWVLFPLYAQTVKRGARTTSAPWPFVRITTGAVHGFGIWPLFEVRERPGAWKQEYFLWPFGYNNTTYPAADSPRGTPPRREIGVLPFYARHTAAGYKDENFLWPFFGYTLHTGATPYHEIRYFWPFLVQGRGKGRYVNRWGPFYTHSITNGYDKTWYAWPLLRRTEWQDRGLDVTRTEFFYFLYWSERERSATHPEKPAAALTHVWPLFSEWHNGAGREQFQLFSPLDVFFPGNEKMRDAWSPLFAIARHEQTAPGESRTSLLWNAITWRRDDLRREREFHLGPLLSVVSKGAERRIALGNGLMAFDREPRAGWKLRWFDFHSKPAKAANLPR